MTVGLVCRGARGANGAVERRRAAPAVVGRLGLVLDKDFGFWASGRRTDGRNWAPPQTPLVLRTGTATELGSRFPFICGFKKSLDPTLVFLGFRSQILGVPGTFLGVAEFYPDFVP